MKWSFVIFLTVAFLVPTRNEAAVIEKKTASSIEKTLVTVKDCIALALENNIEISIQRISPQIDAASIQQAKGDFDPILVLTPNYQENSTPLDAQATVAAGGLTSTKSRTSSLYTGLQGKSLLGTQYDFGLTTSDARNTFNSFKDQYTTFWGLSVTQPLLRGFGSANQTAVLRIARKQKEISDEAFALKVMDIITRIKSAYFNLVYAMENRRVQIQALDLAAKFLEDTRKKVQIGVLAPLEVTIASSGVASREEDVILASQEVTLRSNELRLLISGNISDLRNQDILPIDSPSDAPVHLPDREEIISRAVDFRPDYHQAKLVIEQRHIQLKYDENQRYPQLDLKGTYGYNGVGGTFIRSVDTEGKDGKWSIGLQVKIPIPDNAGEGRLEKSTLEKERAILQLKQVEQNILVEVDNAIDAVNTSFKRISATRVATQASLEALNAEMTKLRAGTSTSFVVLELQKKLSDAKSKEIRALADYNIALAVFQRAQGVTLQDNDIEIVK